MLFITDAMTLSSWLKSLTKDTTSQVENIFSVSLFDDIKKSLNSSHGIPLLLGG